VDRVDEFYSQLDPPIVPLVRALNGLPGIQTSSSCGGHETPISAGSLPADRWMVAFQLEPWDPGALVSVPTRQAWVSLEWLAWLINDETDYTATEMVVPVNRPYRPGVTLKPWSRPPYLYYPGRNLHFTIEGTRSKDGMEPNELAEVITRLADECYIPAEETWPYEDQALGDDADSAV
jgi:hypothetical protein